MDAVQPPEPGASHSVHVPFTQSTTPGKAHGHASLKVMDATSASYCASAELLIGVLPQSHELEQTVPVVTTVQSAAVLQLWLKLEAGTITHDPPPPPSPVPPPRPPSSPEAPPVTRPPHAANSPRRESAATRT
jgi:hypothetical protein